MRFFLILIMLVSAGKMTFSQSQFDIQNLFEYQIYNQDSGILKHRIKSIIKYKISLNQKAEKVLHKSYDNGFLSGYDCFFENYPYMITAKVSEMSSKGFIVSYRIPKSTYENDSLFLYPEYGFISRKMYDSVYNIYLSIYYRQVSDTLFEIEDVLSGIRIGEKKSLYLYNPKLSGVYIEPEVQIGIKGDTLITRTEKVENGKRFVKTKYKTFFAEPILEDTKAYIGDSLSDVGRIERKFDSKKRLILYSEKVGPEFREYKNVITYYSTSGNYTVSEDINFSDGRPDIVTQFNKAGQVVSFKKYNYIHPSNSEVKNYYSKAGLLVKSNIHVNGKLDYSEKYVYSFY